jgi:hypothetical protein
MERKKMTRSCLVLLYLRSGVTAFSAGKTLRGSTEQLAHPAWTLLAGGEVNLKGKVVVGMIKRFLNGTAGT